jgi:Tfp pilus assembly protein PilE
VIRQEQGFTLIEVLVAASIVIVGVLTTFTALDSARRLTLVAERQTSMAHRAQQELERVKSLPYGQIALTGSSSSWSSTAGGYTYVNTSAANCPGSSSGSAPTYQPDYSSGGSTATESLVINGCSYTLNGTTSTLSGGTIAPVTAWTDGRFSGNVYDFITWTADPTCSQGSSPGAICSTSNDYKRITVVVTITGGTQPSHPAIASGYIADPNATPPGAPSNSQQNPITSPTTTCTNSQGQTVPCSNTLNGTPIQYFLSGTPVGGTVSPPSCSGNNVHHTVASVLTTPPSPDQLVTALPTGACTDGSGNPITPCYALDVGCGSNGGEGLPFVPTGSSTCGTAPSDNTKTHSWLTPAVPAGSTVNLNGTGGMTSYIQSDTGASVSATVCVGLYIVPGTVLGTLTGNLLASPIGVAAATSVTAAAGAPTPVSFNFNVGSTGSVTSTVGNLARIEVVIWIAASSSTKVSLAYDQAEFASQVTLMTT